MEKSTTAARDKDRIKSATYHMMEIDPEHNRVKVIFDV
jgi:SHS2 domain-containing protein